MDALTPRELPDPLDRIEFRAVGWQKIHIEFWRLQSPPLLVKPRMVVFGVIDDQDHAASGMGGATL